MVLSDKYKLSGKDLFSAVERENEQFEKLREGEQSEEWFEQYAKLNLKSTTYTRQRQLTKRVYKAIGHIRIDKLTARDIQKFINSLAG